MIPPPKLPPLYPKQHAAIFARERYSIIEASTKVGKTAGCLIWLFVKCWNEGRPGRNYWWVAPIFPQAKIAYNRLKRMLMSSEPQQSGWSYNETELWIELRTGGRIWFKSADKPDSLYGEDVYAVVVDEATRCKDAAWYAVRSTLTATGGPARIIGNVRGRKNWAYTLARKAQSGEPGFSYHKLTAWDAVDGGILTRAEVEDAQAQLPPDVFAELYLAEPSDDGGNPFGLDAIAACERDGIAAGPATSYGIDLAKSRDYTVVCGLNAAGEVCTLHRWQSDWRQTRTRIIDMIGEHAPASVDSTGVGDPIVEDLQRARHRVYGFKFTATSKQQLCEGLAAALQRREVRYPAGWLRNELDAFEYVYTQSGVRYSAPEGLHDDGVCALALAVHCRANHRPATTFGGAAYAAPLRR